MSLEQNPEHHHREMVDKYVSVVGNYQMRTWDYVVRASILSATNITITLPNVAEARGRWYSIVLRAKKGSGTASNKVVITSKGDSEAFAGIDLTTKGSKALCYSDGLTWFIMKGEGTFTSNYEYQGYEYEGYDYEFDQPEP